MTSTPDKNHNLAEARRLFFEALDRGAQLISFPETFSLMTDQAQDFREGADTLKGPTVETLQEWAAEHDVWILGGSIPLKKGGKAQGRITNTSLLISADGDIAARYDKIHLFDAGLSGDRAYRESDEFEPGKKTVVAETPFGRVGLSICYDLRFPELYRELSEKGAQVVFVPSAFTAFTGRAHWDTLTLARAIENQAFIVAPNQTGEPYPGRLTHGHSRIVDPWGRIIAERNAGPGIVVADLDFKEQERIRRELPALEHRKL